MSHVFSISSNVTLTDVTNPVAPQLAGFITGHDTEDRYFVRVFPKGDFKHAQSWAEVGVMADDGSLWKEGQCRFRITGVTSTSNLSALVGEQGKQLEEIRRAMAESQETAANALAQVSKLLQDGIRTIADGTPIADRVEKALKGGGVVKKVIENKVPPRAAEAPASKP